MTNPVICVKCNHKKLYVLSEEGVLWCANCGHTKTVDENHQLKQSRLDDFKEKDTNEV